jgi:adenylyltransferase/sulfurtransferase
MPRVVLPEVLKRVAALDSLQFEAEGLTVGGSIRGLCLATPRLERHLLHPNRTIKEHFIVSVSGRQARDDTPVAPDDVIELLLATAGGTAAPCGLTVPEVSRYARHLSLPQVGREGQIKLKEARVLVVGTGGLGSPISLYLAAAGVGTIGLVDFDVVDESNLQRQVVHGAAAVGMPKVESARRRLLDLNGLVRVVPHALRLTDENASDLVGRYDVAVDGTDNYAARYALNDACLRAGVPYVYGSIGAFHGQVSVFNHADGPCYRCVHPEAPPQDLVSELHPGVLGVVPGVVGALEATEVMKIILRVGAPLSGRLLQFDALAMRNRPAPDVWRG